MLHLCSLIGLGRAPFWQNLWSLWRSFCGLWLYFLVLHLCSLIGTCWCSVLAKPLVSLVLLLWSLIVLSGASFVLSDWACWCPVWQNLWSLWCLLSGASFVLFDWACWCSVLAKSLVYLVLLFWSLIVFSGASFVLSDWACWCSVLAKPLVSLVLLSWSLIVLSGASFVLSDWTCWCPVLAKPLVSLVLLLWSLILVFFCKAYTATRTAKIGQLCHGQAVSQRCFSAPPLVLRLILSGRASAGAPFVASPCAFFDFYFALLHQSKNMPDLA